MHQKTKRLLKIASEFSIYKTLRFNLKYFDFKTALKCPVWISRHVRLRSLKGRVLLGDASSGIVRLGFDTVGIFDNKRDRSIIEISPEATLRFQGKADLGNGFKISLGQGALLTIGHRFMLTANTQIVSLKEIEFGSDVLVSWDCLIMDTDMHKIYSSPGSEQINPPKKITIRDNTWIGCRSVILKGSDIPAGSIIAAGSLVSKNLAEPNAIYGGNPLHELKRDIAWSVH